jgi:hypothetical protein
MKLSAPFITPLGFGPGWECCHIEFNKATITGISLVLCYAWLIRSLRAPLMWSVTGGGTSDRVQITENPHLKHALMQYARISHYIGSLLAQYDITDILLLCGLYSNYIIACFCFIDGYKVDECM